jgi:uncharacterized protein (TIGR03435 family)
MIFVLRLSRPSYYIVFKFKRSSPQLDESARQKTPRAPGLRRHGLKELHTMPQNLLVERFHMAPHRERQNAPAYALNHPRKAACG